MKVDVRHEKNNAKFFATINNKQAYLNYKEKPGGKLEYYETYVPEQYRHQNIASQLAEEALNYAVNNSYKVVPSCPFVDSYAKEKEEFKKVCVND